MKDYELRVTVVNDEFFPVKIQTNEKIDWRKAVEKIQYCSVYLPEDIKKLCSKMMNQLNLKFGAFDFIVNDGRYVFLELNANGQWAWLEEELNLKISDSIIKYLLVR